MIFTTDKVSVEVSRTHSNFLDVELDIDAGDVLGAMGKDGWKELLDAMEREDVKDYLDLREADE